MKIFVPYMYKKDIYEIDYKKLKQNGIKCILFDLDNTLIEANNSKPTKKVKNFLEKLSKEFKVLIISNSPKTRLKKITKELKVDFYSFSMKPLKRNFKKVIKDYSFSNDEIILIGDQFVTDILGANRMKIKTILVDPLSNDLVVTKFNRYLENKIIKSLEKNNLFQKGKYYD